MSHEFRPGEVIAYPYLWAWQHQRGETEGRKPRPVCVVVAVRSARDGLTHLALLAITTQPPQTGRLALEILRSSAKEPGSAASSRAGLSLTNTITISPSAPGTSNRGRRCLAVLASRL